MKKVKIALIIVILLPVVFLFTECILSSVIGRGLLFTEARGQKYKYTDEYKALLTAGSDLISPGEGKDKNFKKVSEYQAGNGDTFNIYTYTYDTGNVTVVTLHSLDSRKENTILGVALKNDFINHYKENEKEEDIIYPVLISRKVFDVHIRVNSKDFVIPGDICKDDKIISIYNKKERKQLIEFLRKNILQHSTQ